MNVLLTPELEQFVTDQVAAGIYFSPNEVVTDALRLLEAHDRLRAERLQDLKARINFGLEQAQRGEVVDGDLVFARLEEKARALGVSNP